jgi:hypothetical protein
MLPLRLVGTCTTDSHAAVYSACFRPALAGMAHTTAVCTQHRGSHTQINVLQGTCRVHLAGLSAEHCKLG